MAKSEREEEQMRKEAWAKVGSARDVFEKLRFACLARSGYGGIRDIGRMFRIYDDDNSKTINLEEFRKGVQDYGLRGLKDEEIKEAFDKCDTDKSGHINFDELLKCMRAPMSERRVKLVEQAFKKMDATGDQLITVEDLRKSYNTRLHPKYLSGEMSEDEILTQFLHRFEGENGNRDGKITLKEFLDYYNGVGANIDSDAYFDLMMRQAYKL